MDEVADDFTKQCLEKLLKECAYLSDNDLRVREVIDDVQKCVMQNRDPSDLLEKLAFTLYNETYGDYIYRGDDRSAAIGFVISHIINDWVQPAEIYSLADSLSWFMAFTELGIDGTPEEQTYISEKIEKYTHHIDYI